jgi:tyrosinase
MMHHGFVDKMWADWQSKDPKRLTDMGGPNAQDPAVGFIEFGGGVEAQSRMWGKPSAAMLAITPDPHAGDNGNITTLNHVLSSVGIIPDATIRDVMDIKGGYLCYEYV